MLNIWKAIKFPINFASKLTIKSFHPFGKLRKRQILFKLELAGKMTIRNIDTSKYPLGTGNVSLV